MNPGLRGSVRFRRHRRLFEFSANVESYIYLRLHIIDGNRSVSRSLEHKLTYVVYPATGSREAS